MSSNDLFRERLKSIKKLQSQDDNKTSLVQKPLKVDQRKTELPSHKQSVIAGKEESFNITQQSIDQDHDFENHESSLFMDISRVDMQKGQIHESVVKDRSRGSSENRQFTSVKSKDIGQTPTTQTSQLTYEQKIQQDPNAGLMPLRGSIFFKEPDSHLIAGLAPGLLDQSINRLSMKLPLNQFMGFDEMSQQDKESFSEKVQNTVALKLNPPKKQDTSGIMFSIVPQRQADGQIKRKLMDQFREHQTESDKDPKYKIALFSENVQAQLSLNERMFEELNLHEQIQKCCSYGQNFTFFSLEGQSFKRYRTSKIFSGNVKVQTPLQKALKHEDSISNPGLIRMVVESLFAYIFSSKPFIDFALKMSYVEVSCEQIYDLFNCGNQIRSEADLKWLDIESIEDAVQFKKQGDGNQLRFLIKQKEDFMYNSTYFIKFMLESSKPQCRYVQRSTFNFVELPDITSTQVKDKSHEALNNILKYQLNPRAKLNIAESKMFQSKLTLMLQKELEGNSRQAYLISASPCADTSQIRIFLEFARQAAKVTQSNIRGNFIQNSESFLNTMKQQLLSKQKELQALELFIQEQTKNVHTHQLSEI